MTIRCWLFSLLLAMGVCPLLVIAQEGSGQDTTLLPSATVAEDLWFKNAIFYNLDVRTFQDSDGDGIGDFRGLTSRLGYLKGLGVDVLWLSPFQPSPHKDDGYDVTDYYGIDSSCGTPGDFADFMYKARQLGLRVIMDVVLAHTSDQHPWFLRAVADTSSAWHSWYTWSKEEPANRFKGMAFPGVQKEIWTYNRRASEFYFHRFYDFQPHLNYINPQVQAEGQRILGYWLNQGLAGFRMDAVPFIVEEPGKTSDKMGHDSTIVPRLRQFVQWRQGNALLLGEANVMPEENSQYFGKKGEGLNMMFNFYANQYLFYGLASGDITLFRRALTDTRKIPSVSQWAWFLRNHDEIDLGRLTAEQRSLVESRFGPDKNMQLYDRGIRRRLAPMLHNQRQLEMSYSLLFSLPGAAVIRYGEELGMGDDLALQERLSVRTPMQWMAGKNAGFTAADKPIRPLIKGEFGYDRINVETETYDSASLLRHVTQFIRLRKECPEIGLGKWTLLDTTDRQVLVMCYAYEGKQLIVVHNFSNQAVNLRIPAGAGDSTPLRDLFTGALLKKTEDYWGVKLEGYGYRWYRVNDL